MNINTWINLIGDTTFIISNNSTLRPYFLLLLSFSGASFIAAGGLATSTNVFIVASMLVSPIMGPILGVILFYI